MKQPGALNQIQIWWVHLYVLLPELNVTIWCRRKCQIILLPYYIEYNVIPAWGFFFLKHGSLLGVGECLVKYSVTTNLLMCGLDCNSFFKGLACSLLDVRKIYSDTREKWKHIFTQKLVHKCTALFIITKSRNLNVLNWWMDKGNVL